MASLWIHRTGVWKFIDDITLASYVVAEWVLLLVTALHLQGAIDGAVTTAHYDHLITSVEKCAIVWCRRPNACRDNPRPHAARTTSNRQELPKD